MQGCLDFGRGSAKLWRRAVTEGKTPLAEPSSRYSTVSLILHWTIAVAVLTQIGLIMARDATEGEAARQLLQTHKAVGLSILVLTLVRLGWRVANPLIALPAGMPTWERFLSRATQFLFYAVLLILPLTGWLASSAAARDISWFGLFDWPLLPIGGGREVAGRFMDAHEMVVKLLYLLIVLHVAGALKHHFINRDNVLRRMLPFIASRP